MSIPFMQLVDRAAILFDTTSKDILGTARFKEFIPPRRAISLVGEVYGMSRAEIGCQLGGRHRASIGHHIMAGNYHYQRDEVFRAHVDELLALANGTGAES